MKTPKPTFTVLSVRQPWASLLLGPKDVENRSWFTVYRGPLLIHASKTLDPDDIDAARGTMETIGVTQSQLDAIGIVKLRDLPLGAIIGCVEVLDCRRESDSPWAIPGQWNWKTRPMFRCDPIPCPGQLGLWKYTGYIEERLTVRTTVNTGNPNASRQ